MNTLKKARLGCKASILKIIAAFVLMGFFNSQAFCVVFYYDGDSSAGPYNLRPNSDAMALSFDTAVNGLGPNHLINFEDQPIGNFSSLNPEAGVTITLKNTKIEPFDYPGISNNQDVKLGYNTTSGGSKFIRIVPIENVGTVSVNFAFDSPIQAFGAYFTGVGTAQGNLHMIFDDGSQQDLPIDGYLNGGVQFIGFLSAEQAVNNVTLQMLNVQENSFDIYGIDDVRYISTPEPASALLIGMGGLIIRFKRRHR